MGYIWSLVREDIRRLKYLFSSLPKIFGKGDELCKKSAELIKLLIALAEMVSNSKKQYEVDDEEKQDEGSVLDDEEKQHERSVLELKKHERVVLELWLEELQDAVFNMEDLVAKIHTEALQHKLDGQICEKMEDIRCSLESYVKQGDVLGLAGRIYNLECLVNLQGMHHPDEDLLDMNNLMQRWFSGLMESRDDWMESPSECLDPTDFIYFVDESEVFGMDCGKEEIIKLLLSNDASDKQLSVISMEGNGRIGKTTLARLVYNEQRVSHHFHLKAWVRVSDDFDSVIRSILNFFILKIKELEVLNSEYNGLDELNSDELGLRLQQCLEGKRFLLVLDGAKQTPSSKGWEALRYALKDAANGSCIIVTTRNKDIAPMVDAVSTYRLEPLPEERSWSLFAKSAFGDQNPTPDTQLEVIGKEIVQMCHGLPSSVRILGSLLRSKLQREEWEAMLERLKPSSDSRENVNVIPADLKLPERCLAYFSIFPQDYEFGKERLVFLWMAEGFLNRLQFDQLMNVSDESFGEWKSFFQESNLKRMNNLAAHVSTRYCFRLEDNHPSHIPLNTRYLSLVGGKYENSVIFEAIDRTKLLRTFLALDHESRHLCATELQNLLSKLQFLRVLSFSNYHITEIPDSIGNLKHLRYIDLSYTAIKRLPESVCELCNLQSLILSNCHSLTEFPENMSNLKNLLNLDVSGSGLNEIPDSIGNLKHLQYIDFSHIAIKRLPESVCELYNLKSLILSNCHSLTELPENMSNLENLSYLDVSGSGLNEIPDSIGNLNYLQYIDLSHTAIKRLPESVCEIHYLQSLILSNCHSLTELPENMSNIKNLLDLDVSGSSLNEMHDSIGNLNYLQYIDLSHTAIKRLPESVCELYNLKSLILSNCHSLTELPENMSKLEILLHLDVSGSGLNEIPDSIGNLNYLQYIDLSYTAIKRLPESVCELCNLQSLILLNCHSLTEFPENMSNLKNLLNLDVSGSGLNEIPDSIGNLKHLQYIDFSHTAIKRLPELVCELSNLKSLILSNCHSLTELPENMSKLESLLNLDVSGSGLNEIPDSIGNLNYLQYIDLSHTAIKRLPESVCELYYLQSLILSNCHSLTKLPENTSNLENLSYLEVSGSGLSEMPKGMHKLRNLKFLPCFVVGKESGSTLRELFHIDLEGTLHISKLQNVTYEEGVDILPLAGLFHLEELVLEWDDNTADPEDATKVFAGLIPSGFLKKLTINFYCGTNFADFFKRWESNCMVFLRLSNCKNCSSLPLLGNLPSLRVLSIECMDAVEEVGPDFSAEPSQTLEILTFEGMAKWTKWVPWNQFPSLKQLFIRRCPKLRGNLPKLLPSVERVEISESQELVTALTIEASLNKLHYFKKIVFISDDKVTSFTSEGATGSSSLMIEGKVTEKPKETEERGQTKEETDVEIQTTSKTNWSKHEQKESTEDPSQIPSSEEKSSLPLTQHALECLSLVTPDEKSSLRLTQGAAESLLPLAEDVVDTSAPITQDEKSSLHLTEGAAEFLLPLAEDVVDTSVPITQVLSTTINKKLKEISETEESGESDEADVPSDTWSNSSFESMKVSEISELMALPTPLHSLKIEGCDVLRSIPESVIKNPSLQHLYIISCCSLKSFPIGMALKILYIRNCKKLEFPLANEDVHLDELEDLSVGSSCDSLTDLSLHLFPKLRSLSIWDCAKLQKLSVPEKIQIELTSLEALEIRDCPNLEYFPTGGLPTPNLKSIRFSNCKSLKKLPDQLGPLKFLESMFINDCPELESLSKQVLPSKLSLLRIASCNKLISGMEWGLHGLSSLCQLEIEGECKNVESFPVEGLLPSNLSSLHISKLSDLKKLDNTGLKKLESLKTLEISCCDKLQFLPEDGFPSSLSFLCIKECPLLKPKLQNKNGEDWYKIAHISCIEIDEEVFS